MTVKYLSQFDLLQIRTRLAAQLHERFDVFNLHGLQSALAAPRQVVFGEELCPTLWDKAAVLLIRLIKNHPFYDGNKRIAMIAAAEFLRRNGWQLTAPVASSAAFAREITVGDVDEVEVARWLERNAVSH